jgi:hypothetical protein
MRPARALCAALGAALLFAAPPAGAVLDINDRGPVLQAGDFFLRVTNAGIVGNAFFNQGRSFDPSMEYPKGSGHELLGHAELWVGAITPEGRARVSGGPMLEWRPTLDAADRVRTAWGGTPGTRRRFDDDGDSRTDEERLDGLDDDGDGLVDEDLGLVSDEMMTAEYTDDQPEAINYGYSTGESHEALGLSVHQEAYAWTAPGYDGVAGLHFTVRNHGTRTLTQVYLGLYCDLDSRGRTESAGHLNDVLTHRTYSLVFPSYTAAVATCAKPCTESYQATLPVVVDGAANSGLPAGAVLPLTHTTDPLGLLKDNGLPGVHQAIAAARAPVRDTTFREIPFAVDLPPGQGGPPVMDIERYAAMAGQYPGAVTTNAGGHDWSVLVTCGPFVRLAPGDSLEFEVALVAAATPGDMDLALANARFLHHGFRRNLQADGGGGWRAGDTYTNGHEICLEPPTGITFTYYPHCVEKFVEDPACLPPGGIPPSLGDGEEPTRYVHGRCVWTDLDCDLCTGYGGAETLFRWLNPGAAPPPPARHVAPADHRVTIAWDDLPEVLLRTGAAGDSGFAFAGYRLFRLSKWSRETELPPPSQWQMIASFRRDSLDRSQSLAAYTDSTVPAEPGYGGQHHGIGRYRYVDTEVQNGFDYLYMVTTLVERAPPPGGSMVAERLESPIVASLDSVVTPHFTAQGNAAQVWVVPNPYRAHAAWDRPPVPGDPFRRHVDFCGLPRARAVIRVYTVAGDLVARLDHDGSAGDGEASWDLISRNGQEVESGIYLFTVESSLGHAIGRFVVIR